MDKTIDFYLSYDENEKYPIGKPSGDFPSYLTVLNKISKNLFDILKDNLYLKRIIAEEDVDNATLVVTDNLPEYFYREEFVKNDNGNYYASNFIANKNGTSYTFSPVINPEETEKNKLYYLYYSS
jgi:hypothetical protein